MAAAQVALEVIPEAGERHGRVTPRRSARQIRLRVLLPNCSTLNYAASLFSNSNTLL